MALPKALLCLSVVILFIASVSAQAEPLCLPPGFPCKSDKQCCASLICNPWAGRCTKGSGLPPGQDCTPAGALCSESDGRPCCGTLICNPEKNRCLSPPKPLEESNIL